MKQKKKLQKEESSEKLIEGDFFFSHSFLKKKIKAFVLSVVFEM